MSSKIKKIGESLSQSDNPEFPKEISLYTSNGNFNYKLLKVYSDGLLIKATYFVNSNITSKTLPIDEPENLYIEIHSHSDEMGDKKTIINIVYGRANKFEFTIQSPDILKVINYNGFGSKFDSESKFAFSDKSILDFVKCLNSLGFKFNKDHFQFMDKYPYSYQYYESVSLSPIFGGKILVLNNGEPNRRSYLPNVLTYLVTRGLNYVVTSSVSEIDSILKTENIVGVISTGSDYRISQPRSETEQALSHKALKEINKPLIGMCYGFQSMADFYGSKVVDSGKFFNDNIKLSNWSKKCDIFKKINVGDFQLSVSFHDVIKKCPKGFQVIAEYEGHILGIENRELMRWGLAFHPEDIESTYPILDNFIDICRQSNEVKESTVIKFSNYLNKDLK